jgi:uncharacterized lipoprotein
MIRLWLYSVISLFLLTGCSYIPGSSYIQNRDKQYLNAKSIPPLRVPPGLSSQAIQNHYPISSRNDLEKNKEVSQLPPGLFSP